MVDLGPQPIGRWREVLDGERFEHFTSSMTGAAEQLEGRTLWNLNSTAEGGGVAEMLSTLLPYAVDAGWDVRWAVLNGDAEFFETTKGIHNALHGTPPTDERVWHEAPDVYRRVTDAALDDLIAPVRPGDVALVHDPQVAGLIPHLKQAGAAVSWQCHVGTDDPNECTRLAWDVLRPYVEPADRYVFTRASYLWDGLDADRLSVIPPSIDAFAPKNNPLDEREIRDAIRFAEIPEGVRIVLEVSRWDRLKDPIGFLRMYDEHMADRNDVHLVYAGPSTNGVADDPEGAAVLAACHEVRRSLDPDIQRRVHLLELPMDDIDQNAKMVNALQRRADVVVQKSIEEGFGLTVAEAMWKKRPVVASRVGGIQDQIEHGRSGLLVDDPYDLGAFTDGVLSLLGSPDKAKVMGEHARQRVEEHFLGPRQLEQYAELFLRLSDTQRAA